MLLTFVTINSNNKTWFVYIVYATDLNVLMTVSQMPVYAKLHVAILCVFFILSDARITCTGVQIKSEIYTVCRVCIAGSENFNLTVYVVQFTRLQKFVKAQLADM